MQNFKLQVTSLSSWQVLSLVVCLIAGANALGQCTFYNGAIPAECTVRCSGYGVNGDIEDPGVAAATFLNSLFPEYGSVCSQKWILEIADSKFPGDTLRSNWLQTLTGDPILMNITDLILHTDQLTSIAPGAFDSLRLGSHVIRLAIYYNKLNSITNEMTLGLTSLESFEWVGNGIITRVDPDAVLPFRNSVAVMQISDCEFDDANVVANITGCQAEGSLPNLRSLDLGYNTGPGLAVLVNSHFTQLTGVFSMYLWNSNIEHVNDSTVFDAVAPTIQSINLSNNKLTTMVNGTLNSIIAENKQRFTIALAGNPWKCDCQLAWLQAVIRFSLGNVALADAPKCSSPASEAGKFLIDADMSSSCAPYTPPPNIDLTC